MKLWTDKNQKAKTEKGQEMKEIQYKIVKEIAVLSASDSGYTKEINLISWNGREPKYDIRSFSPNRVVLCQEKVQIKHELFTLIFYFVSMLLQFLNVLISASTSFHIHLAKCIRSDYVFLLYYKMPLCIQI